MRKLSIILAIIAILSIIFMALPTSIMASIKTPIPLLYNKYAIGNEIIELRTENSKVYWLGGDTYGSKITIAPMHYKNDYLNPNEEWKDIDLTLENGKITKAPYDLTIDYVNKSIEVRDKRTGSVVIASISSIGDRNFNTKDVSNFYLYKSKAEWKDAAIDTDIIIEASNSQVRFKRILKSDKAPAMAVFDITQTGNGLTIISDARYSDNKDKISVITSRDANKLTETVDKSKVTRYPIEIDPTITAYTSSSDGRIYAMCAAPYNNGWVAASGDGVAYVDTTFLIGQIYAVPWYYFDRSFVYFDTSSIPAAATVTATTLNLYGSSDETTGADFLITVQSGMATYPHDPMVIADYSKANYGGDGGSLTTVGYNLAGYNIITFNATGRGWVQKGVGAITKLCLRSSLDIAGTAPTGYERIGAWASEEAGTGKDPYLYVTYAAVAPIITTTAASDKTGTTARLNAALNDDGYEPCNVAFGWDIHTHGCDIGAYAYTCNSTGTYTTGETPYCDIGGLICNTTYYYCAKAWNSGGVDTGGELTFTTEACAGGATAPTFFNGMPAPYSISLTWVRAIGSDFTMIRYSKGCGSSCAVTSNTTGTLTYNGTLSYYILTGLDHSTNYCFYAFANGWSTANVSLCVATMPPLGESTIIVSPTQPNRWFAAPDHTTQVDNFLYEPTNTIIDYFGGNRSYYWLFIALMVAFAGGVIMYIIFRKAWIAMFMILLLLLFGWSQKLVPMWMVFAIAAAGIGLLASRPFGGTDE